VRACGPGRGVHTSHYAGYRGRLAGLRQCSIVAERGSPRAFRLSSAPGACVTLATGWRWWKHRRGGYRRGAAGVCAPDPPAGGLSLAGCGRYGCGQGWAGPIATCCYAAASLQAVRASTQAFQRHYWCLYAHSKSNIPRCRATSCHPSPAGLVPAKVQVPGGMARRHRARPARSALL
jgi:hypothetical protein